MKKLISFILCIAIVVVGITPVRAEIFNNSRNKEIIHISDTGYLEVSNRLEETPFNNLDSSRSNSDSDEFEIKYFENNVIVQKVKGQYGGKYLYITDYKNGIMVKEDILDIEENQRKAEQELKREMRFTTNEPEELNPIAVTSGKYGWQIGKINYKKYLDDKYHTFRIYSKMQYIDDENYIINGQSAQLLSTIIGIVLSVLGAVISRNADLARQIAVSIIAGLGGSVAGGVIGVTFSEPVSVKAYHYTLTAAAKENSYSSGYDGIDRRVQTRTSLNFNKWISEGYTPRTWKLNNELANYVWEELIGPHCPGVLKYE